MLWSVKRNIDLFVCSAFIYIEFYYGLGTAKEKISNIMKLTFKQRREPINGSANNRRRRL